MAKTSVFAPLFDDGLTSVNFFNGRLLSAEDLKTETNANREGRRRLGQALGDGVVRGLDVTLPHVVATSVSVTAGLAINRLGDSIVLPAPTEVSILTGETTPVGAGAVNAFDYCKPPQTGSYRAGAGVYVLTVSPARGRKGRAPVSGLGNELASCSAKYLVEGVEFAIVPLSADDLLDDQQRLQNRLAYRCFGIDTLETFSVGPFATERDYGALAALRDAKTLTDCEVPLALMYWIEEGVQFVDSWAVRRRPVALLDPAEPWRALAAARRVAEAEAMLSQFQDHVDRLIRTSANPATLRASDSFRFLPPAGLVPVRNTRFALGVDVDTFFSGLAYGAAKPIDAAQVRPLVLESLSHEPIDVTSGRRLQLYSVNENLSAQSDMNPPQPVVIFTSDYLQYFSTKPRFADLCNTLKATMAAYRGLAQRHAFFAKETGTAGVEARLQIEGAIRDVIEVARDTVPVICFGGPAIDRAIQALKDLYDIQKDLLTLASTMFLGLNDVAARTFAQLLGTYLDVAGDAGAPSLSAALAQQNLARATAAQNELDRAISGWSGTVLSGNLDVVYERSTRGRTLVRDDRALFFYVFKITNNTNKRLDTVRLVGDFLSPKDREWTPFASVVDMTGASLSVLPNPLEPNASVEVQIAVKTPTDGLGEKGTLRLQAISPAPNGTADADYVALTIGDAEVPDADYLEFIPPVHVSGGATVGGAISYTFQAVFRSGIDTQRRECRFRMQITSAAADLGLFTITLPGIETPPSTATDRVTKPVTFDRNVPQEIAVRVGPKAGSSGKTFSFNFSIKFEDGTLEVDSGSTIAATVT